MEMSALVNFLTSRLQPLLHMGTKAAVGGLAVGITYFGLRASIGPRNKRFQTKIPGIKHSYIKTNLKAYPIISTHLNALFDFAATPTATQAFNNVVVLCCKVGHIDNKFWAGEYSLSEQSERLHSIQTAVSKVERDCNVIKAQVYGTDKAEYDGNGADDMDDIDMSIQCIVGELRQIAFAFSTAHAYNRIHRRK